jgi:hypothetical protein
VVNKCRLGALLCFFCISLNLQAAVNSQIDKRVIEQGETFLLLLNITKSDVNKLDLSPLEKDFELLGRSHQSSATITNGEMQSTTKLILTLAPKRAGKLIVPALSLENEQSQPHQLEVTAVKQLSAVDGGVEMLSTLSDDSPVVQQPLIYQMSLVLGQRIFNAAFQEPKIIEGKALIEPLGEQSQYRQTLNGREMLVVEQSWMITPQQSGVLTIDAAKLSAEMQSAAGVQNPYRRSTDPRAMRRIFVSADSYELDVAPIPAEFQGDKWLAANALSLESRLSTEKWKQGEPVTRTITLHAKGVAQDQLPSIKLPEIVGLKQYTAKPVIEQTYVDNTLTSKLVLEVTLIPSRSGVILLPEVRLPWWNTENDSQQMAVVPEQEIEVAVGEQVLNAVERVQPLSIQTGDLGIKTAPKEPLNSPVISESKTSEQNMQSKTPLWLLLVIGAGGVVLGGLLTFIGLRRHARTVKTLSVTADSNTKAFSMASLERACRSDDAVAARKALLDWASNVDPSATHLNAAILHSTEILSDAITDLNQSSYAANGAEWKGDLLWKAVKDLDTTLVVDNSPVQGLGPLYVK